MRSRAMRTGFLAAICVVGAACSSSSGSSTPTSHAQGTHGVNCAHLSALERSYATRVSTVAAGLDGLSVGQQIATARELKRDAVEASLDITDIQALLRGHVPSNTLGEWGRASTTLLGRYTKAALGHDSATQMANLDIALQLTPVGFAATTSGARIGSVVKGICPGLSVPTIEQPN